MCFTHKGAAASSIYYLIMPKTLSARWPGFRFPLYLAFHGVWKVYSAFSFWFKHMKDLDQNSQQWILCHIIYQYLDSLIPTAGRRSMAAPLQAFSMRPVSCQTHISNCTCWPEKQLTPVTFLHPLTLGQNEPYVYRCFIRYLVRQLVTSLLKSGENRHKSLRKGPIPPAIIPSWSLYSLTKQWCQKRTNFSNRRTYGGWFSFKV